MSKSTTPQGPEPRGTGIVLAGVGRDGAAFVDRLDRLPETVRKLFITSSPTRSIADSPALLRARQGGDWCDALAGALDGSRLFVLIATMAGREETFAPDALAVARGEGLLAVAVLAEPVLVSAPAQGDPAARLIDQTVKSADATLLFPAASFLHANTPLNEAMEKWFYQLSSSVRGFLAAAAAEDALNMQFSDIAAALSGHCRATIGTSTGKTIEDALVGATGHALAPPAEVATARSAVAHLVGGPQMSLDDARRAAPVLTRLLPTAEICCGVSLDPSETDIRATIIAGKLDPDAALAGNRTRLTPAESTFFKVGDPSVYGGENLDVPAFIRANVVLPGASPRPVPAQTTLFDRAPTPRQ